MKLSKQQRAVLREMFGGKCAYCGCVLPEKGWHADHVEPLYRGWRRQSPRYQDRDVVGNFFPSCAACNLWKTVSDIETFRAAIEDQADAARKYSRNFRLAERFGLVAQIETKVVFWFEKYKTTAAQIAAEEKPYGHC